ncbi:MAG: 6-phosphogluconolactonase, partial [Candidatus Marinimicrobia bacterium]|nr:6-phosphogluconolactonase [Candidatus Neomarinimicrobiota bacterium]
KYIREFTNIDWLRVTAFHMDEYLGISDESAQSFGNWLRSNLFNHIDFGAVHFLNPNPAHIDEELTRYSDLINSAPIDIVCLGIGENGHIAFNDPTVADFKDPKTVKAVKLEDTSRQQQVNEACFRKLSDVPPEALTITVPVLFNGKTLICVVPGKKKSLAVKQTIEGDISVDCPASILRRHSDAHLFLDYDSAELLNLEELAG